MIKIGDFSNLAHVSIKTLHHYDDMGLLKPAHIDRFSGYRYYTIQQLATLNRILALKDLGLSLEQVAQLLDDDISPAEMRGMLRLKRMELTARVDEDKPACRVWNSACASSNRKATATSRRWLSSRYPPR